ncbi:Beta-lactamase/transpeptidase-like protein [Moelleriella libera RCEF 2490]|uniref:Beta-lactamase/transpeptidase-like protein n=1 Tax=Moelleriella libera RCEF 2490 TaxID=1081109 RepID=A0A162IL16_9HYPO|nr:Beta-lactamase/transpeptidase-like protein [Moelleriella libera RCEF 2490]
MDKLDDILRRYTAADDDAVCTDKLLGAAFVVTGTHEKEEKKKKQAAPPNPPADTLYSGAAGRLHLGAGSARFTDRSCTWLDAGGAGLFTTAADYALLLRAFLRHALVAPETTSQMLEPQLDETRADLFNTVAFHPLVRSTMAPEFPDGQRLNHGLAGVVNLDHVPGKRRAGSIAWSGILNSRWVCASSPESSLCRVLQGKS